jgi:dTDP-4-amino-4,6-dideoxygalactose transaminase
LQEREIGVMVNYRAIHLLTYFRETFGFKPGDFPIAERIGDSTISLPFYPAMPAEHVDYLAEALGSIFGVRRQAA